MCHMTTSVHMTGFIPSFTAADRVRKAREHTGMTQGALAEALGVARTTIARIEQGQSSPRRPVLIAIAMATGVDLAWLETGETPAGNPDGGEECAIRDLNPEPADLRGVSLQAAA